MLGEGVSKMAVQLLIPSTIAAFTHAPITEDVMMSFGRRANAPNGRCGRARSSASPALSPFSSSKDAVELPAATMAARKDTYLYFSIE